MRYWRDKGLTGLRLFTFGSTMSEQANWLDDPKSFPAWACAGELGLSVCLQMSAKAIPQAAGMAKRFPNVRIILDHGARPVLEDGPPYDAAAGLFGLARYPNIYLKLTPRMFAESRRGQATPETFFPRLVSEFGARAVGLGVELSVQRRQIAGAFEGRAQIRRQFDEGRSGMDLCQDRAGALSGAGELRRSQ